MNDIPVWEPRNAIPVNVFDKRKVIAKGELLGAPVTCIDNNHKLTAAQSSEILKVELLKSAEFHKGQRSTAGQLIT